MSTPPVARRAAPPPFSRQRNRSRLILGSLVCALVAVALVGALVTVPTHIVVPATVGQARDCRAARAPVGPAGCVLVRATPEWADRLGVTSPAQLTTTDGDTLPIVLTRIAPADGATLAAPLDAPAGGGVTASAGSTATAAIAVGRRPLALLFLGHGLDARR